MAAMFGSSLAAISDIPFNGSIAGVQVAYATEDFIINPSAADRDFTFRARQWQVPKEAINMVGQVLRNCLGILCCKSTLERRHERLIKSWLISKEYIVAAVGKERAEGLNF